MKNGDKTNPGKLIVPDTVDTAARMITFALNLYLDEGLTQVLKDILGNIFRQKDTLITDNEQIRQRVAELEEQVADLVARNMEDEQAIIG